MDTTTLMPLLGVLCVAILIGVIVTLTVRRFLTSAFSARSRPKGPKGFYADQTRPDPDGITYVDLKPRQGIRTLGASGSLPGFIGQGEVRNPNGLCRLHGVSLSVCGCPE